MAAFHFRLQRVLEWQNKVCKLEEDQLHAALRVLAADDEALARLQADFLAVEEDYHARSRLGGDELRALADWRKGMAARERRLHAQRRQHAAAADEHRLRVLDARRKSQRLDLIRGRALREFEAAAAHELEVLALESHLARHHAARR